MSEDVGRCLKIVIVIIISMFILTIGTAIYTFASSAANGGGNTNQTRLYYSEDGENFYPYNNTNKFMWYYRVMPIVIPHTIHH